MPAQTPAPLPEPLKYLQPFTKALAKLPPEKCNEDVDPSRLEKALRKRLQGLDDAAAVAALSRDQELLAAWLKDKPDHPAHWISGFLLYAELTMCLTEPDEPSPPDIEIHFEAPEGWTAKPGPSRLDLKAGKIIGSIMESDEFSFGRQSEELKRKAAQVLPPDAEHTHVVSDVSFGPCRGKKCIHLTTSPIHWKEVEYLLHVPGGAVSIMLATLKGKDFDEVPLESKLHTLRISVLA
jgi:hypothetical protein